MEYKHIETEFNTQNKQNIATWEGDETPTSDRNQELGGKEKRMGEVSCRFFSKTAQKRSRGVEGILDLSQP